MFRLHPYQIPFSSPLTLPGVGEMRFRKGLLIHHLETGGWGDAAPLPGFSAETIDDVCDVFSGEGWRECGFPSVRFALECAELPLEDLYGECRVNALWIPERESLPDFRIRIRAWDAPVVKVKPGKIPDVKPLLALLQQSPACRLRIDGNRQWTPEQVLEFFEKLPPDAVEYLEEPLQEPEAYPDLWKRAPVPVALDESLLLPEGTVLARHPEVKTLVLKPTLLGNAADREPWTALAAAQGKTLVWSSCFESGVGLWHLVRLAGGKGHHGLDTNGVFAADTVIPRPVGKQGRICLKSGSLRTVV